MIENWKNIKEYEIYYQVSNTGKVKRKKGYRCKNERILKTFYSNNNYELVELCKDGSRKKFLVHRLVAEAFLKNSENKPEVNHIDGNKFNNKLDNLEWCTKSENQLHSIKNGLRSAEGVKNSQSKINEKDVLVIRKLKGVLNYKKIAKKFNISISSVCSIINKNTWNHVK